MIIIVHLNTNGNETSGRLADLDLNGLLRYKVIIIIIIIIIVIIIITIIIIIIINLWLHRRP